MSFDTFTAEIAISALVNEPTEENSNNIHTLLKELSDQGGPSQEAIDFFKQNENKQCLIKHTSYKGLIVRLNTANGGFYPGSLFPIKVKILETSDPMFERAIGSVFEYDFTDLIVCD